MLVYNKALYLCWFGCEILLEIVPKINRTSQ